MKTHKVELEGWLYNNLKFKKYPKFGYPRNTLPITNGLCLNISGGFLEAFDDEKQLEKEKFK